MQCPGCGLYHPARYEQCVSCGRRFNDSVGTPSQLEEPESEESEEEYEDEDEEDRRVSRKTDNKKAAKSGKGKDKERSRTERSNKESKKGIPLIGLTVAAGILLASAGGTYFFLSRPPESDRLLSQGQKELANGQYAFAQKTLEQAKAIKPSDPQILMSLARAYVGTDQVEKAWSCISQVQQSGPGVLTDPQLTSDLAKYYVQRNQYERAAELLRPLAEQNIAHKKTELADLDALWGDACFNKGETAQALKCWEELKTLGEGSRFNEVDTRLASIYQKMSNEQLAKDDLEGALKSLNNLNTIAPSPQGFEKSADIYSKQDNLDLAIDQIRRALKLGNGSHDLNHKLAGLLSRRGKELLDKGDTETGYAYLQQAQGYDSNMKVPTVALRSIVVNVDKLSGTVHCTGEAWNPGPNAVSYLSVRAELYDSNTAQTIWSKEQKIVDEFVAPLQARENRQFELSGQLAGGQDGIQLRVYLNGNLYKSYPLNASEQNNNTLGNSGQSGNNHSINAGSPSSYPPVAPPILTPLKQTPPPNQELPPVSPVPMPVPLPGQTQATSNQAPGMSPEERTLKDLE